MVLRALVLRAMVLRALVLRAMNLWKMNLWKMNLWKMALWDWLVTCVKFVIMGLIYYVTGQILLALLYYFVLVGLPLFCLRLTLGDDVFSLKSLLLLIVGLDLIEQGFDSESRDKHFRNENRIRA